MKTQDSIDYDQDSAIVDRTFHHAIHNGHNNNGVVWASELKLEYENNFEEKGSYCIFEGN